MRLRKTFSLGMTALAALTLASCYGKMNESIRWSYNKEDMNDFLEDKAYLLQEPYNSTFFVNLGYQMFNETLDVNDVIVFNYTKLRNDWDNETVSHTYLSYEVALDYQVKAKTFEKEEDGTGFSITYDTTDTDIYYALVNKDATKSNRFAILIGETFIEAGNGDDEDEVAKDEVYFCNNIVNQMNRSSWPAVKDILNIVSSACLLGFGVAAGEYAPIISGLTGMFNYIGDLAVSDSATNADIYNKLLGVERNIDRLASVINKNQAILQGDITQVALTGDQTLVTSLENQTISFYEDYIKVINDYTRNLKDEQNNFLRSFVNSSQVINVSYDSDYETVLLRENSNEGSVYTFTFNSFPNAKALLDKNNQVPTKDFENEIKKDIELGISSQNTPSFRDAAKLVEDIYAKIIETFYAQYYSNNQTRAQEIRNLAINLAYRISGQGVKSILSSYSEYMQSTYNFASECKTLFSNVCANIDVILTKIGALAEIACYYNNLSYEELENAYKDAVKCVANAKDEFNSIDNNYSFVNKKVAAGTLIEITYNDENRGYGHQMVFEKTSSSSKEINIDNYELFDTVALGRMYARYKLIKARGENDASSFISYLSKKSIIKESAMNQYEKDGNRTSYCKITTSISERPMTTNDSILLTPIKSNTDASYFRFESSYRYGDSSDKRSYQYWDGNVTEVNYFYNDGSNSLKTACAVAWYHEDHTLWRIPENWVFASTGDYSFIIYAK